MIDFTPMDANPAAPAANSAQCEALYLERGILKDQLAEVERRGYWCYEVVVQLRRKIEQLEKERSD